MKIGYVRVSTQDQNTDLQVDALTNAGCDKVFEEKASGATKERPVLQQILDMLRNGDVLIVWKLDRLSRSVQDTIKIVKEIQEKGAHFLSIQDSIDTSSPMGKFQFHVFAALGELERDTIRERTMAGLQAARTRGKVGGRPKGLDKNAQNKATIIKSLYNDKKLSIAEICNTVNVSKATLYRYLKT